MALILSIETSTSVCSVALHEQGELLLDREEHEPQSAAAKLTPMIDWLFHETGMNKSRLRGVAVSAGPGSYTGLRIGVATAKGICFALDIPLITLDSLHVLSQGMITKPASGFLCPMIDARRMEVYTCLLTAAQHVVEPTRSMVVDENSFSSALEHEQVLFFGNGADKCREIIRHPNARFEQGMYPRAAFMGEQAFRRFESAAFADVRLFEPAYLKEFVAKTKTSGLGL